MIVCPNCNHPNPEGANQCESCYTPLPSTTNCPNCGAPVQTDAVFCGQCGFNLTGISAPIPQSEINFQEIFETETPVAPIEIPEFQMSATERSMTYSAPENPTPSTPIITPAPSAVNSQTTLQTQTASLLHVQTNTSLEIPQNLTVIHIGKPNDRIPPDLDVSGFADSDIISRIHADIRIEGDAYYIEDVGSANGTYINHAPLSPGNRHRLRVGDRISLGKGDKVSFIFQIS
jgi:hypothetical protein